MEHLVWDDLRVLLAVHRERSFLAAGRVLGMSTSTTSRRIDALEAAVGRTLVSRSRTGTEVEQSALTLVNLAEALEFGLKVDARDRGALGGTVRVSVPDGMAIEAASLLLALQREHPEIAIELMAENAVSDVAKRQSDVGLRLHRSTSQVLVEKQVATLRFGLFAAEDYVRRHLPTRHLRPKDAHRHPFIRLEKRWEKLPHEVWMTALGASQCRFRSSSAFAILEAVVSGAGLSALVEQVGQRANLVNIGVAIPPPTQAMYLVFHREQRKVPNIRRVAAAIEAHLQRHTSSSSPSSSSSLSSSPSSASSSSSSSSTTTPASNARRAGRGPAHQRTRTSSS